MANLRAGLKYTRPAIIRPSAKWIWVTGRATLNLARLTSAPRRRRLTPRAASI